MKKFIVAIIACAVLLVGIVVFAKNHLAEEQSGSTVPPTASEVIEGESDQGFSQNYFWATLG